MKEVDVSSLEHTSWRCQYHVVFAPKYRRYKLPCKYVIPYYSEKNDGDYFYMRDKTQDDRFFILTLSPLQRSLGIPVVTAPWSGKDEQLRLFILFVLATNGNPRQSGGKNSLWRGEK